MTAVNLATADLFQAEIARLQAENDRLRSQPCPYVTGDVTRFCTLTPLTLTDAEREAVERGIQAIGLAPCDEKTLALADTLRGLLERTK